MKILYDELNEILRSKLVYKGFSEKAAAECARLFAQATLDGVNSHGVNRFSLFIKNIDKGLIDVNAKPQVMVTHGALEQWDGLNGSGLNNASFAVQRAIALADEHGIACVALRNTNHWMRGGNYGLMAAEAGMLGICWTNTMPNMPVWGGAEALIGNNPLVFAAPHTPWPVLLDTAMSLYSYGQMENHVRASTQLPFPGGFNQALEQTRDPKAIMESGLPLPIGYWKGSGLSILLDLFATLLSGGLSTADIGTLNEETRLSQVFICLKPDGLISKEKMQTVTADILNYISNSKKLGDDPVRYPGKRSFELREHQLENGVQVDDAIWRCILELPG